MPNSPRPLPTPVRPASRGRSRSEVLPRYRGVEPVADTENPFLRAVGGRGLRIEELRGQDLNLRPSGYEPDELPGCSTPRHVPKGRFKCPMRSRKYLSNHATSREKSLS